MPASIGTPDWRACDECENLLEDGSCVHEGGLGVSYDLMSDSFICDDFVERKCGVGSVQTADIRMKHQTTLLIPTFFFVKTGSATENLNRRKNNDRHRPPELA